MPRTPGASDPGALRAGARGGWWFRRWPGPGIAAGLTDRHTPLERLVDELGPGVRTAQAEQVHGASVAVLNRIEGQVPPIAGCDGLWTAEGGLALLIRTADCLPLYFAEPRRGIAGLAHVGWRGLRAGLPARMVSAGMAAYRLIPEDLAVAVGPAIRACCYEVGAEFAALFGPHVRRRNGRLTCDLVGAALEQLARCGVRPARVLDSGLCTACSPRRWFSLRREGQATGRLVSVIMIKNMTE
ncbi:MAG: polyphenol oxidase family protein, partial [Candidatus Omnitrophica bacterium]|nr:polyphenol oxidase family protein [Candidatus Omnitrophota bacterium]